MGRVCTPPGKHGVLRGKDIEEIPLGECNDDDFDLASFKDKSPGRSFSPSVIASTTLEAGVSQTPTKFHEWLRVTSFQMVYSSVNAGMGLFVLPAEAQRLNAGNASLWLGAYLALCGIAQLVCPIAGKLSDQHCSRWGRRRPYIFLAGIISIACFGAMGFFSLMVWPVCYLIALFIGQFALNVAYAAQCGLPADLQGISPDDPNQENHKENGVVSGAVALHSFCGSLVAMGIIIGTRSLPVYIEYPLYMLQLAIVVLLVCISARETPTHTQFPKTTLSLVEIGRSFSIDPKRDIDFFWVCIGRMFYYVSTCPVVFIKYYIRDMLHVADEAQMRVMLAILIICAQLMGAIFAVPFSRLSNSYGRKKVIYLACTIMSSTFSLYIIAPKVGSDGSWPLALVAGLCYGVGSGAYLSVDYALALDCLPVGKSTAEAFGLWGVIGFIGSTAGPLFGGALLAANQVSTQDGGEYGFWGYALLMAGLGCAMNGLVVLCTKEIQKAK